MAKKEKHVNQQREINLEEEEKSAVPEEKIERQRERVQDLRDMVCLETEVFECIFEMPPKKQYSRYVERLSDKRSREMKVQTGEETEEKGMQSTAMYMTYPILERPGATRTSVPKTGASITWSVTRRPPNCSRWTSGSASTWSSSSQ